jgi:hypothetical protein
MMEERTRLANLLTEAAELEHSVVCQYLFLAFSMKRDQKEGGVTWQQLELMRKWETDLLAIARQEMEHLGIVANLLTAIGEAPHFARPNFPVPSDYFPVDDPPSLEPFGLAPLRRLIRFEQPAHPLPQNASLFAATFPDDAAKPPKTTVGELYGAIKKRFQDLNAVDPKSLFIGPPSAQRTTTDVIPVPVRGVPLKPGAAQYDVKLEPVTDLASAVKVIQQIIEEGEGIQNDTDTSHYRRLLVMAANLKKELASDLSFAPARPVLKNPTAQRIKNPATRVVFELFENAYETAILMLLRYFGQTDTAAPDVHNLQQAVFFPMMTTVLRPLGEILTQLPADTNGSADRAGPSFKFVRRIAFLPHRDAAQQLVIMRLRAMAEELKDAQQSTAYPVPIRNRLSLIYENMERIHLNFDRQMAPS